MKKFLKTILLFSSAIIMLVSIFEILMQFIPTSYNYKHEILERESAIAEVLILGSSHTACQIDPDSLSRPTINAANLAQLYRYDLYIFDKYFSAMPNLRFVILPISYFSFEKPLDYDIGVGRDIYYARFMGFPYALTPSNYLFSWDMRNSLSKIRRHYIDKSFDIEYCSSSKGFIGVGPERRIKAGERWNTPQFPLISDTIHFEANALAIEHIAKQCASKSVKLLLVTTPATDNYINYIEGNYWRRIQSRVQYITTKYSNVSYHNFMHDPIMTLDDFVDPDHLIKEGAHKFTLQIDSLL